MTSTRARSAPQPAVKDETATTPGGGKPASPDQLSLIRRLLTERVVEPKIRTRGLKATEPGNTPAMGAARDMIDWLLAQPETPEQQAKLAALPNGRTVPAGVYEHDDEVYIVTANKATAGLPEAEQQCYAVRYVEGGRNEFGKSFIYLLSLGEKMSARRASKYLPRQH